MQIPIVSKDVLTISKHLHRLTLSLDGVVRASRSKPRPIPEEHPWDGQHEQREESQQARCPRDAHRIVHLHDEQRESGTEEVPQ